MKNPFKIRLYDGIAYALNITSKTDFNTNNGKYPQTPTRMA